jgi:hypothetical protein
MEAASQALIAPNGLDEIVKMFGNIYDYIHPDGQLDPQWEADCLALVALPFPLPLPLSWDHSKSVTQFLCHKHLTGILGDVFGAVQARGLRAKIHSFGGCFAFRPQRTGVRLSTHSWGIAIDLNPESNGQGSVGDMDASVIEIFRSAGFTWGGDWSGKSRDPMHFQFCTGY